MKLKEKVAIVTGGARGIGEAIGRCLAAEGDSDSADACRSASGEQYWINIYPGDAHGMELIRPDTDPETLGLVLDFLELAFGL